MTVFNFSILLLVYLCSNASSFYIQMKRFDYDPSEYFMYNQMYSHQKWRPYRYEVDNPTIEDEEGEDFVPNLDSLSEGRTVDKRVTADQINSLLKNAWLGR